MADETVGIIQVDEVAGQINVAAKIISDSEESESSDEASFGCSHYRRKCQLVCPDASCAKVYTCRFCHDETEASHEFNRYQVKEVVCLLCKERQPVAAKCRSCCVVFGKYFCSICNLFNDEDRHQYHCEGCGLCRVGPAENFFHCPRCDMCFPIKLQGKHKCIERASRCPCAVCYEDIHTARTASHIPPCGHLIHQPCFEKLINKAHYTCPICNASMIDMKAVWSYFDTEIQKSPMPVEYEKTTVRILCRDCHKLSTILFHFMGLKCGHCGGYNTCIESHGPVSTNETEDANMRAEDEPADENDVPSSI
ncbi:unnamed protein product [Allacma fusca]|uniref:Uncharacterized protein n=1 Tax=Allacma fusca TaxID=39272 RepID=A0A8J2JJB0_9HEXA|nr:unnamed protein product [Allacma fusca]